VEDKQLTQVIDKKKATKIESKFDKKILKKLYRDL